MPRQVTINARNLFLMKDNKFSRPTLDATSFSINEQLIILERKGYNVNVDVSDYQDREHVLIVLKHLATLKQAYRDDEVPK